MRYAELLCRTHYSFLRGASHPRELVDRAAELGLAALAVTDRDGVYGMPKAYHASRSHPKLKLLVGAELTIEKRASLRLLAIDRKGYGLMCRMLTASHADKPKGQASLTWQELTEYMGRNESQGLIALPNLGERDGDLPALKEMFEDRLYLPITRVLDGLDWRRTRRVRELAKELNAPIVASNDVHFHQPERRKLHDVMTSIREIEPLEKIGRKIFPNAERYLKSPAEMAELFRDMPEALERTLEVADRCRFDPGELRYRYPSEWIPAGETSQSYLERLTWEGAKGRYPQGIPDDVARQIRHEFALIAQMGFADYFLTIWEIVEFAKGRKILCQGRGSAANSAVCYCLGITAVDPVRMNLLFERFISAERGEPPDIDVDFEHERREEVIQHIYEKYGRDRAGMVAALITYRTRSIKRDVSKALGVDPESERLEPFLEELRGVPRHLSIHSGGFTLSADALIETVPIEPARMEGRTIVQWDKEDLDRIGLLKVDILALGMLSALRKTLDLVQHKAPLTLATIPHDDKPTYAMIQKAETVGTFQIESRAQMGMLKRLLPKNFYDLVIEVAIVRPGPIVGDMVHPFLKRRRGLEPVEYPHPGLVPILSKTLGVPIFQEQVMKMAIDLAGFSPGEADELRRSIAAWRSTGSVEKMGRRLMAGLLKAGLPQDFVERIFKQIQGFAEYGFPESHAASFALLAYASCYLKCHFPGEFVCALINSQPMGFYSNHTLVEEAKRSGVEVRPVHPNRSRWDCVMEGDALRIGLRVVSGLGQTEAEKLVEERARGGVFRGLADMMSRIWLSPRVWNALAMGEAFACFGLTQRQALWEILQHQILRLSKREPEQMSLFGGLEMGEEREIFPRLTAFEAVQADYQSYGLSTRAHPMKALRFDPEFRGRIPAANSGSVKRLPQGRVVRVSGLIIVRQRPSTAKNTTFATLEDEAGFLDLILHEKTYERYYDVFMENAFLTVTGQVQRDGQMLNLIVRKLEAVFTLDGPREVKTRSRDFY